MSKTEILKQLYDEEMDKVFNCSGNYLMTIPKKGFEKEFALYKERAELLKQLLAESAC